MNRLQTIDADTLQSTAYEPVSFVVDDLLPQGLHLLAGAPKIGKSWLASMVSGIIMSRYVFAFLNLRGGLGWARTVHMLAAYWGFVFLSLHQGLHWAVMIGIAKKQVKAKSSVCSVIVKILGILIAGYGGYAFGQRQIASYMFLQSMFVYFDFEEPLVFFILDYMAIMGLFVGGGYYVSKGLKGLGKKK